MLCANRKELLAVMYACEKFFQYIYGQNTTVQSDHTPLEAIFHKSISGTTPRLQCLLLCLLKFQLNMKYVPGKYLHLADTLPRAYLNTEPTAVEHKITEDRGYCLYGCTQHNH